MIEGMVHVLEKLNSVLDPKGESRKQVRHMAGEYTWAEKIMDWLMDERDKRTRAAQDEFYRYVEWPE